MKLFDLQQISEHRSSIMGVGIIWVVLYHFQVEGLFAPLTINGFMGVDLFMFVSGFGLYYSLKKNNNLKQFYRKRLIRILPLYLAIGLLYELLHGDFNFFCFIWKYSTLGYWTNGEYGFGWFIPGIMAIYFFYPFLHRTLFYEGYEKIVPPILFMVFYFFIVWCVINQNSLDRNHFLLLYRIPIFLLGVITAFKINWGGHNSNIFFIFSLLLVPLFFVRFISLPNRLLWDFSTTFIIPFLIVLLCIIFSYIRFLRVMKVIGSASLEIFCLHYVIADVVRQFSIDAHHYTSVMYLACLVTVILGVLTHLGWEKIIKLV